MFSDVETVGPPAGPARDWRERALARSLGEARSRSAERLDRLVSAARDLAAATESAAFTVHQVVERAGLSLKSFYSCFAGKDDLLLALLEEDSRIGADILAGAIERETDPEARVRAYVRGILGMAALPEARGYVSVLVREYLRLLDRHPAELRRALAPLVDLLGAELAAAVHAGVARADDPARDTVTVFGLVMSEISGLVLAPEPVDAADLADHVWRFCWSGLRADDRAERGRTTP